MALKQEGVHCVLCPKQRNKIKGIVLNRACILQLFCAEVRVSNPQRLTYMQISDECHPLPPGTPACSHSACSLSVGPFIQGKITPVLRKMHPK